MLFILERTFGVEQALPKLFKKQSLIQHVMSSIHQNQFPEFEIHLLIQNFQSYDN